MLLNLSLPFAQEMLDKHGEFFPYGAAVAASGDSKLVAGNPGEGEQPTSSGVLAQLVNGLRSQRDSLRATAVVSAVRTPDSDAVRVELEHREGLAMAVLLPYSKNSLQPGVEYGPLAAAPANPQVWAAS